VDETLAALVTLVTSAALAASATSATSQSSIFGKSRIKTIVKHIRAEWPHPIQAKHTYSGNDLNRYL